MQLNITLNTNQPKKKRKEKAAGGARRLLQHCQLPDKNSRDTSRDIWNFSRYFKICIYVFIYFKISSGSPTDVLRDPGWETLVYRHAQVVNSYEQ
jgi:hypothetical protein